MDGTRDLHDHELEKAADESLGSPRVVASNLCIFCTREGDYGLRGKRVCRMCADSIYRLHRDHKRKCEAVDHGVRAADPTKLFRPIVLPSTPSLPSRHYRSDWNEPA